MKILLLIAIILLSSCGKKEPYWRDVCIESHLQTIMMPTTINGMTTMRPQQNVICDKYEKRCIVPKKWEGDPICPSLNEIENF